MDGLQKVCGPLALYANCMLSAFVLVEVHIIKRHCYKRPHWVFLEKKPLANTAQQRRLVGPWGRLLIGWESATNMKEWPCGPYRVRTEVLTTK